MLVCWIRWDKLPEGSVGLGVVLTRKPTTGNQRIGCLHTGIIMAFLNKLCLFIAEDIVRFEA